MAEQDYYVDTKRAVAETPNMFSGFVESYLKYRMPVVMMATRARIDALLQSGGDQARLTDALTQLAQEKAGIVKEMARLQGTETTAAAQRDTNFATIKAARLGLEGTTKSAQATAAAAQMAANASIQRGLIDYQSKVAEGSQITDKSKPIIEAGVNAMRSAADQLKSGTFDRDTYFNALSNVSQDVGRLGLSASGEADAAAAYLNQYSREVFGNLDPKLQPMAVEPVQMLFRAADPLLTPTPDPIRGGVGGVDYDKLSKEFDADYGGSGQQFSTVGGSGSGSTTTTTSTGRTEPAGTGGGPGSGGAGSAMQRQIDDIDALMKDIRERQSTADEFRGLGNFDERLGGNRPASPRPARGGGGGSPDRDTKPAKEPKAEKPDRPTLKQRAADLAGSFLGSVVNKAVEKKEEKPPKGSAFTPNSQGGTQLGKDGKGKADALAFTGPNADDNRKTKKKVGASAFTDETSIA